MKIVGNTVGMGLPKPNLKQTDPRKGDFVKGKDEIPTKASQLENDAGYLTEHQDISGKLDANKLPEAVNAALAQANASGEFKGDTGPQGPKGDTGATGPQGPKGADGTGVTILGSYASAGELTAQHPTGTPGDSYLVGGHLYVWSATTNGWEDVGNIQGPQGIQGIQGEKGDKGDTGPQGPAGEKGETGEKGDTGATGATGANGKDGVSATHSWNGTKLTITSASGTSSANLKGEKGDKGDSIKGDKGDTGATGQRGTGLLPVTTAPSGYTTAVGGITPKYRMAISTIKTQAGVTEVLLGDTVIYSYYHYPIEYLDASYAYMATRVSIRGATGADGKTAYQYAQDGGYTGTEEEFAAKLASEQAGNNPLQGKKVSFLGDSICAGSSESTSYLGGYGKIIADRNGMVYENVAHGGATVTAETYSRSTGNAKPWLCRMVANMSADADYAIIEGGINDGWDETVKAKIGKISVGYNATLDDTTYYGAFESMLKQLVTKFQGKKIGYIAVPKIHSLYDSSQNAPNFYHIALECCAKWGVSVCDLNTITPPVEYLSDLGTTYVIDGTHPTYEGYLKYYCDPIEAWMRTLTTGASVCRVASIATDDFLKKGDIQTKKAQLTLEDGTTVLIDVVVASTGSAIQTYLNLLSSAIDTDESVYNGVGWKGKTRVSASNGSVKESTTSSPIYASLTGFIPVQPGATVRFKIKNANKHWDVSTLNLGWNIIAYYDSSFTWLGSNCPLQSATSVYGICTTADNVCTGSVANDGIVSFTVPSNSSIAWLRLAVCDENSIGLGDMIITVNQEITD